MECFYPNIGLNRTFIKNIKFNVLNDTIEYSEVIEQNINSELVEKLLMNNLSNITDQNQLSKILPGIMNSDLSSIPDNLKVSTLITLISSTTKSKKKINKK